MRAAAGFASNQGPSYSFALERQRCPHQMVSLVHIDVDAWPPPWCPHFGLTPSPGASRLPSLPLAKLEYQSFRMPALLHSFQRDSRGYVATKKGIGVQGNASNM
jgi:hypothetical protein